MEKGQINFAMNVKNARWDNNEWRINLETSNQVITLLGWFKTKCLQSSLAVFGELQIKAPPTATLTVIWHSLGNQY